METFAAAAIPPCNQLSCQRLQTSLCRTVDDCDRQDRYSRAAEVFARAHRSSLRRAVGCDWEDPFPLLHQVQCVVLVLRRPLIQRHPTYLRPCSSQMNQQPHTFASRSGTRHTRLCRRLVTRRYRTPSSPGQTRDAEVHRQILCILSRIPRHVSLTQCTAGGQLDMLRSARPRGAPEAHWSPFWAWCSRPLCMAACGQHSGSTVTPQRLWLSVAVRALHVARR